MVESDQNKLFVGGISRETTADTLTDHFGKYGVVVCSEIRKDRNTRVPRGFGFVSFSDASAVDKALQDTHVILERTVEVKKATSRKEQQQNQQLNRGFSSNNRSNGRRNGQFRTQKIFVGGLPPSLTEDEFKSYFEKFGRITDVVIMHDSMTKRPRGFGFITFDSEDAVEDVMQNNSFHDLSGKVVEVKRAVPKEGNYFSNNGYAARLGLGRGSTFDSYPTGSYPIYSRYGILPGYGPPSPYGVTAGYPYGTSFFGGGYFAGGFGGIGYRVPAVVPGSPWNGHSVIGVGGNPMPYGSTASVYPPTPYLNGGVGVMPSAANGYNGIMGMGANE
ncbi:heterogeneous nuclear ribonucleoprotein 1-like [Cornus florida]|uniref:heterogeneous nuclear ribonucleoprotein 1-like n=1 Tax=Cornus florida TaxID=4283 RepID=UPI00289959B2|nr:heterogeneous nuclear ribonucleoprotein 1-like [Cornus florida]